MIIYTYSHSILFLLHIKLTILKISMTNYNTNEQKKIKSTFSNNESHDFSVSSDFKM
jgi:hypothetical protein